MFRLNFSIFLKIFNEIFAFFVNFKECTRIFGANLEKYLDELIICNNMGFERGQPAEANECIKILEEKATKTFNFFKKISKMILFHF